MVFLSDPVTQFNLLSLDTYLKIMFKLPSPITSSS